MVSIALTSEVMELTLTENSIYVNRRQKTYFEFFMAGGSIGAWNVTRASLIRAVWAVESGYV